jgi:metallo-beta-lactamase family protein
MSISLTFLGAAQTVTGSKHLLEVNGQRVLVDCGMFQGPKSLRQRNWQDLPVPPSSLAAVVLTHAHLDHSGWLPRLVNDGFSKRIYCTPGTLDLCRLVLPDAGRLQEEDARQANKHGYTKHEPALPLFTEADALRTLLQLQPVGYERPIPVMPGVEVEFIPAGHLLGSAYARMSVGGKDGQTILFGGDLGRYGRPVLPDPAPVDGADILLLESTYGDRLHAPDDNGDELAAVINEAVERGGKIIVPAFAIGRVEEVLYWIKRLEDSNRIPVLPVFVDSPMAVDALKFYSDRRHELDEELTQASQNGHRRGARAVSLFATARFQTIQSPRHSRELTASDAPAIVISSSGMATGGRVLHHLEAALDDPRHTVLFVGFQAEGTRGRQLVDGALSVKMHGRVIPVTAKIVKIDSMSAHADQGEILRWLGNFKAPPRMTYLVHGEPGPMAVLKRTIEERLSWKVHVPALGETVSLDV